MNRNNILIFKNYTLGALLTLTISGCASHHTYVSVEHDSPNTRRIHAWGHHACGRPTIEFAALNAAAKETLKAGLKDFGIIKSHFSNQTYEAWIPQQTTTTTKVVKKDGTTSIIKSDNNESVTVVANNDIDHITTSRKTTGNYWETRGNFAYDIWIRFSKDNERHSTQRINAYDILGPKWETELRKDNTVGCSN